MSTINVNHKPCDCFSPPSGMCTHPPSCAGTPILIPCPIPPTVEFTVRVGECACCGPFPRDFGTVFLHANSCPARPIRVFCSISGKTWEGSEVVLASVEPDDPQADRVKCMADCRELWALVKALVLGHNKPLVLGSMSVRDAAALIEQRDAVYAALADMARAEKTHRKATAKVIEALNAAEPVPRTNPNAGSYALAQDGTENAENGLAAFVDILIERLGSL